jgi:alpha-tubulin suppressor-like RCC1 family protein
MTLGKPGDKHIHVIMDKDAYFTKFDTRDVLITFDENNLEDEGANNFDGVFYDSPTSGQGHSGNATTGKGLAMLFEDEEYFEIPNLSGNNFPQDRGSINFWLKPSSDTVFGANLFGSNVSTLQQFTFVYDDSNTSVDLHVHDPSGYATTTGNPVAQLDVTEDSWNYISMSWDVDTNEFNVASNGNTSSVSVQFNSWRPYQQQAIAEPTAWVDNYEIKSTTTSTADMIDDYENGLDLLSGDYVVSWGENAAGQLYQDSDAIYVTSPTVATSLTDPAQIGIGDHHAVVLLANGTVKTMGISSQGDVDGQLGNGSLSVTYDLTTISGFEDDVTDLAVSSYFNVALMANGNVMTWGYNGGGQLGLGTSSVADTTNRTSPTLVTGVSDVTDIAVGLNHVLVLSGGTVYAWGLNVDGQLGDGTTTMSSAPVTLTIPGTVTAIACGDSHSIALTNAGLVYAWGKNSKGQVGDGGTSDVTSPYQVIGPNAVSLIEAGSQFTVAYSDTNDDLYSFGQTDYGLGSGTDFGDYVIVDSSFADVVEMAAGKFHVIFRKSDGTVWAWGRNHQAQLGIGNTTDQNSPTQISSLTDAIKVLAVGNSSYAVGQ